MVDKVQSTYYGTRTPTRTYFVRYVRTRTVRYLRTTDPVIPTVPYDVRIPVPYSTHISDHDVPSILPVCNLIIHYVCSDLRMIFNELELLPCS